MSSSHTQGVRKPVRVHFPAVHGLAAGQLVTINCFPSLEMKGTIKVVTGVDEEIARRIIGASRYAEHDERAGTGVMVLFSNPLFTGESYGLALAVADKLARYEVSGEWREIYATGKIPADGCGRVEAVQSIAEKIAILLQHAQPNSLFLYPQSNRQECQETLRLLQDKGVRCHAVAHVEELADQIWPISSAQSPYADPAIPLAKKSRPSFFRPVFIGMAVVTALFLGVYIFLNMDVSVTQTNSLALESHQERPQRISVPESSQEYPEPPPTSALDRSPRSIPTDTKVF